MAAGRRMNAEIQEMTVSHTPETDATETVTQDSHKFNNAEQAVRP
jgi:hypothetical protein